jgi:hypothetical protein
MMPSGESFKPQPHRLGLSLRPQERGFELTWLSKHNVHSSLQSNQRQTRQPTFRNSLVHLLIRSRWSELGS